MARKVQINQLVKSSYVCGFSTEVVFIYVLSLYMEKETIQVVFAHSYILELSLLYYYWSLFQLKWSFDSVS